jgi:hypothetical protein
MEKLEMYAEDDTTTKVSYDKDYPKLALSILQTSGSAKILQQVVLTQEESIELYRFLGEVLK